MSIRTYAKRSSRLKLRPGDLDEDIEVPLGASVVPAVAPASAPSSSKRLFPFPRSTVMVSEAEALFDGLQASPSPGSAGEPVRLPVAPKPTPSSPSVPASETWGKGSPSPTASPMREIPATTFFGDAARKQGVSSLAGYMFARSRVGVGTKTGAMMKTKTTVSPSRSRVRVAAPKAISDSHSHSPAAKRRRHKASGLVSTGTGTSASSTTTSTSTPVPVRAKRGRCRDGDAEAESLDFVLNSDSDREHDLAGDPDLGGMLDAIAGSMDAVASASARAKIMTGTGAGAAALRDLFDDSPRRGAGTGRPPRTPVKGRGQTKTKLDLGMSTPTRSKWPRSPARARPYKRHSSDVDAMVEAVDAHSQSQSQSSVYDHDDDDDLDLGDRDSRSVSMVSSSVESSPGSGGRHPQHDAMAYAFADPTDGAPVNVSSHTDQQEGGEVRIVLDDVEYAIDGLEPSHPCRLRALSACKMVQLCASSDTRFLLRAHDYLGKLVTALAASNVGESWSLALPASVLLWLLARDSVNVEYFGDTRAMTVLAASLRATESVSVQSGQDSKKIRGYLVGNGLAHLLKPEKETEKERGHGHSHSHGPSLDSTFTPAAFALDTLVRVLRHMPATRAAMRLGLGDGSVLDALVDFGLQRISTLIDGGADGDSDRDSDTNTNATTNTNSLAMSELAFALKALEWSCLLNPENQEHLVGSDLVASLVHAVEACTAQLNVNRLNLQTETVTVADTTATGIDSRVDMIAGCTRLLLNLTNGSEAAAVLVGTECKGVRASLDALQAPVPVSDRYDATLLQIGLLTNLLETGARGGGEGGHDGGNGNADVLCAISGLSLDVCGVRLDVEDHAGAGRDSCSAVELLCALFVSLNGDRHADTDTDTPGSSTEDHILSGHIAALLCILVGMGSGIKRAVVDACERFVPRPYPAHYKSVAERPLIPLVVAFESFVEFQRSSGLMVEEALESVEALLKTLGCD